MACLQVFESNVPDFFVEGERAEFGTFLDELPGPYFVIEDEAGAVIACGGFAESPGLADLCWGMVRRDLHRRGIGDLLLRERLARITARADIRLVRLDTTQHTRAYYERAGFRVDRVTRDGYAPGMDRYDMLLELPRDPSPLPGI